MGQVSGWYSSLPTRGGASTLPGGAALPGSRTNRARKPAKARSQPRKGSTRPKGKPACKYGPRGADGYCPKKPSRPKGAKVASFKLPKRQSRTIGRLGSAVGGSIAASTVRGAIRSAPLIKTLLKSPVGAIAGAGIGTAATSALAVAAAGLLSYYVTSQIIAARKAKRMKRAEEAAIAADGYRQARLDLERQQGRPLTAAEQRILAFNFQQQLAALGLSTTDLGGL